MAKNTTLGRRAPNPETEMKRNQGLYRPRRTASQSGDTADFAFNGQMGDGVNREPGHYNGAYAGNQVGLTMKEYYGRGPLTGNASDSGNEHDIGPSATRDPHKKTIATASQGGRINGGTELRPFPNPDAINVGMK